MGSECESEAAAVRKYLIVYAIAWAYFKHFVRFAGTFNGEHERNGEWQGVARGDKGEGSGRSRVESRRLKLTQSN